MLAFGVGFGVGVALANVIVESASRKSADSSQVEALGHSVLNALMTAVPDSISKRLHR